MASGRRSGRRCTGGSGSSARYSETLTEKMLYQAGAPDGRLCAPHFRQSENGVDAGSWDAPRRHRGGAVGGGDFPHSWPSRAARRVVEPLNRLDLEHPLDNDAYEELSPLLGRVYAPAAGDPPSGRDLRQQQDEFAQITGSMREGLVLLDHSGRILSINPAAQALFHADGTLRRTGLS